MNGREDRVFTADFGDIEAIIMPGEVLDILRAEADKLKRHVSAPIFLDVTSEFLRHIYFSRSDVRFQASSVLDGHAIGFFLSCPDRNFDEAGITGKSQLRGELRPAEVTLYIPRGLEKLDRVGIDQQKRIALRSFGVIQSSAELGDD